MRDATQALLVIDVQNDFCPGGALAVPGGDDIVPGINALMAEFSAVILTQDWHPADHLSFASQHPGKAPMEMTEMPYGPAGPLARPLRAGQPTARAFHPDLDTTRADLIIRKGFRREIDSYSAFFENDQSHADRARGLSQDARHHDTDPRRPRHRFLRELLRRRCRAAGLRGRGARRSRARHRPQRIARRGEGRHGGCGRGLLL
jgi:nicotinamidase-related amidase